METLNKIKVLLGMEQEVTKEELSEAAEQMKFEDITLEDGTIVSADALEVGATVFIMVEEEKQPLPVGEYALADGSLLVVAEEGIIAEIKAAEEEVKEEEEAPAEEMQEADNSKDALIEAIGVLENLVQEFATIKTEFNTLKEKYESVQEEAKELETKVEEFEKVGEEIKPSPEGNFNRVELSPLEFSRLTSQQKVQYNINKSK
jgi:DNA repair exonuclease SbcCD ATPase subunit